MNYIFVLEGQSWTFEDAKGLTPTDTPTFEIFNNFIDKFFEDNNPSTSDNKSNQEFTNAKKGKKTITKWMSSVENIHTKQINTLTINYSLQKVLSEQSIDKAIPGGKYGCAMMLKFCGPEILRTLSLGKLCAYVQQA